MSYILSKERSGGKGPFPKRKMFLDRVYIILANKGEPPIVKIVLTARISGQGKISHRMDYIRCHQNNKKEGKNKIGMKEGPLGLPSKHHDCHYCPFPKSVIKDLLMI